MRLSNQDFCKLVRPASCKLRSRRSPHAMRGTLSSAHPCTRRFHVTLVAGDLMSRHERQLEALLLPALAGSLPQRRGRSAAAESIRSTDSIIACASRAFGDVLTRRVAGPQARSHSASRMFFGRATLQALVAATKLGRFTCKCALVKLPF